MLKKIILMRYTIIGFLFLFAMLASCASQKTASKETVKNEIKVMTYNVHHCNPPDKKDVIDVDAIAEVIRQQNADMVAVQEVDVNTGRSGKINQAALLSQKSGLPHYYFAKAMDYDGGEYGLLILSKYPLSNTQTIQLPKTENKRDEPRVLALATITLPGGLLIRFGSTHLEAFNKTSRMLQIKEINRVAASTTLPFMVAGDFNAEEKSDVIQTLDLSFTRTCYNCPKTFDEASESGTIDYIAFKKDNPFVVKSHQVIQNKTASDHFPVVALLQIKK